MSSLYPSTVIEEVNLRLDIRRLMQAIDYRFEKYQESGKGVKCFCPIHREGIFRNLLIDKEKRTFKCQYSPCPGSQGGDLVSLYAQAMQVSTDEAVRAIARAQNLAVELPVDQGYVERVLTEAGETLTQGGVEEAETRYRELLQGNPRLAEAYEGLMKVYESRGETDQRAEALAQVCRLKIAAGKAGEARELIQEWADLQPDSPQARLANAELVLADGEAEDAVMEFMGAGDAAENVGDMEGAARAYLRAEEISTGHKIDVIDVTPHLVRVLTASGRKSEAAAHLRGLSDRALAAGDTAQAAALLSAGLQVDPDDPGLHRRFAEVAAQVPASENLATQVFNTADFFIAREDHEDAIRVLEDFVRVWPDHETGLRRLINEYNNHGRAADALDVEARLASLLYDAGRPEESHEIIERTLLWQPEHVATLSVLGAIHEADNKQDEAREVKRRLAKSLIGRKSFAEALTVLEVMLLQEPDADDLIDLKALALESRANSEGDTEAAAEAASLLETLGDKHMRSNSPRRAAELFERVSNLLEQPPAALLFKLGSAYLGLGNSSKGRDAVILACENLAARDKLDEAILEAENYYAQMPQEFDLARYLAELYLRFDDKPAAVAQLRRLASDLTAAGRTEEAEQVYEQALEFEPQNLDTLAEQARMHQESKNLPKYTQVVLRMANMHSTEGRHEEALALLEQLAQVAKDDLMVATRLVETSAGMKRPDATRRWQLHLARLYRNSSDFDREARILRDILVKADEDEEALHLLAQCEFNRSDKPAGVAAARRLASLQQRTGRADAARKTLVNAAERAPEHQEINRDLFEFHRTAGQPNQAVTWGRKLISLLASSGKTSEAATLFDQVVELDADNLALKQDQVRFLVESGRDAEVAEKRLGLANIYIRQERFNDAEKMLQAVIQTDPRSAEGRRSLAELYRRLGDAGKAEAQLIALASVFNMDGEIEEAISTLKGVIKASPENEEARRQLIQVYQGQENPLAVSELHDLATIYRRQNMEVEALAAEREAIELAPRDIAARQRLAESLIQANRPLQAAEELEVVATTLAERGKTDDAMATLTTVLELDPNRLSSRKLRAEILTKQGDSAGALAELQALAEVATNLALTHLPASATPLADTPMLALVPEYTFEHFVVGANNDFAYATALAIARSPARAYNPFFLYADVGLGKTHLCNAIANYLLEHDSKARIIYTNSEDFTGELVESIQNNAVQAFRSRYRNLDLLIVDDVQFLAGKERAQEEFFHIFNALFQAKRQIVITSDRPPVEIAHLEHRLRSRFGAGVIVDIALPDLETRLAILQREVKDAGIKVEPWVTATLAERIDTNVRDLKAALNQVNAMQQVKNEMITEEALRRMLDQLHGPKEPVA